MELKLTNDALYDDCKEVTDFIWAELESRKMFELLYKYKNGVGLAANQVGLRARIIVINTASFKKAMFNPRIVKGSSQIVNSEEGCLSFEEGKPTAVLQRHKQVTVEWQNMHGSIKKQKFRGIDALVIQHEIDHLDGVTIF